MSKVITYTSNSFSRLCNLPSQKSDVMGGVNKDLLYSTTPQADDEWIAAVSKLSITSGLTMEQVEGHIREAQLTPPRALIFIDSIPDDFQGK